MVRRLTHGRLAAIVRTRLKKRASARAQRELLKLRGKVGFTLTLDELRHDRR